MNKLLLVLALLIIPTIYAHEHGHGHKHHKKAHNINNYTYVAIPTNCNEGVEIIGKGETTRLEKVWDEAKAELNCQARHGLIENGTRYKITVRWRGKTFVRHMVARAMNLGISIEFRF